MQRNSSDYKVIFSTKTHAFAEQYRQALIKGETVPGSDFCGSLAQHWIDTYSIDKTSDQKALNALLTAYPYGGNGREFLKDKKPTLSELLSNKELSTETFLALLLRTKHPVIYAESGIYGDHRDWNPQEMYILGNANVFVKDVTVYDSGERKGKIKLRYKKEEGLPTCTYIYTPGVLLNNAKGLLSADRSEVTDKKFELNQEQFTATYIQRLLPVLIEANKAAKGKNKKAFINLPGLGSGCFAGDYDKSTVQQYLKNTIKELIEKHHDQLTNISAICLDLYEDKEQSTTRIPSKGKKGIDFILSPAKETDLAHLQKPEKFNSKYKNDDWYVFVAYDHVAMIDNEANHNREAYKLSIVPQTEKLADIKLAPGNVYFEHAKEGLKYRVIDLTGQPAEGTISHEILGTQELASLNLDFLEENYLTLLTYISTTEPGHTTVATTNRGASDEAAKGSASNAAERVFGITGTYDKGEAIFIPTMGGSYRSQIIKDRFVFCPKDESIIHHDATKEEKPDHSQVYKTFTDSYQRKYEAVKETDIKTYTDEAASWFNEKERPAELKSFYEKMFVTHDHHGLYYYYAREPNIKKVHDKIKAIHDNIASKNKNPTFPAIQAFLINVMKSAYTSDEKPENIVKNLQVILDGFNDNTASSYSKFQKFTDALSKDLKLNPIQEGLFNDMNELFKAIDKTKSEELEAVFPTESKEGSKKAEIERNLRQRRLFFSIQTQLRLCLTDFLLDPKADLETLKQNVETLIVKAERLLGGKRLKKLRDVFENSVMPEEKLYEKLCLKEKSTKDPGESLPFPFIPIRKALFRSSLPESKEKKSDAKKESNVRVYVTPTWKKWAEDVKGNPERTLRFTKPGYIHLFPEEKDTRAKRVIFSALREKKALASDWKDPNASHDRTFTKHRVIVTEIKPYTAPKDKEVKSVSIITACAPNMMENSSREDRHRFSEGKDEQKNRTLQKDEYKKACDELANLICAAAVKEGKAEIVMPDFGVGAYIETLDDPNKEIAKQIMREAFYNAAHEHNRKVTWVIYEGEPNDKKAQEKATKEVNLLNERFGNNSLIFETGDFLEKMRKSEQFQLFLNPGSDRTIGGRYLNCRTTNTLEEKIAGEYDLVVQSSVLNPAVVEAHTLAKVIIVEPAIKAEMEAEAKEIDTEIALEIQHAEIDAKIAELEKQLKAEEQKTAPKPKPPSTNRLGSHTKPPAPTRAPPPRPGTTTEEKHAPTIYSAGGPIAPPLPKTPPPSFPPRSVPSTSDKDPTHVDKSPTTPVATKAEEKEDINGLFDPNAILRSSSSILGQFTSLKVEEDAQLPALGSMTSPPISIWRAAFNEVFINGNGQGFLHYFLNLPEWKSNAPLGSRALRIASGFCAILISPLTFMINAFIRLPFETLFKMGELSFKRDTSKPNWSPKNWPNYVFGATSSLVRYLFSFNPIKAYQECSHKDARSAQFFSFLGETWGKRAGGLWGVLLSLVGMVGMTLVVPVAITSLVSIASSSTATTVTNGFTMVDNFLNFSATSAGVSISAIDTAGTGLAAVAVVTEATVSSTKTIFDTMGSKPAGIPAAADAPVVPPGAAAETSTAPPTPAPKSSPFPKNNS